MVDYYDESGKSAKKFLVRKPVNNAIMRSGFGGRRHPILGYVKMHTGVDWATPYGTPIFASGNGVVEKVGWEGGYGKYVRLKHNNGYETAYGHMSAFAKGIEPGKRVRQGQVIGFVGSTGMSTGAHVHYEILVNGRFVDPMRVKLPRGRSLEGPLLASFEKERDRLDAQMNNRGNGARVSDAAGTSRDATGQQPLSLRYYPEYSRSSARVVCRRCGAAPGTSREVRLPNGAPRQILPPNKSGGSVMTSRLALGAAVAAAFLHQRSRRFGADICGHPTGSRLGISRRAWPWNRQGRAIVCRQRRGCCDVRSRSQQRYRKDRDPDAGRHGGRHRVRARRHHGVDRISHRRSLLAQGRRPDQEARLRPRRINSLAFRKDGRLLRLAVFLGDTLYEIDVEGAKPPRQIMEKMGGLNGFEFGPDDLLYGPLWFKGQVAKIDVDKAELTWSPMASRSRRRSISIPRAISWWSIPRSVNW